MEKELRLLLLKTSKEIIDHGYGFLLEAGTTKRNVKTLLKEFVYRRNHMSSLEKLQFSHKRTTVGSRKVLWFEKQRNFLRRFVLIIFI